MISSFNYWITPVGKSCPHFGGFFPGLSQGNRMQGAQSRLTLMVIQVKEKNPTLCTPFLVDDEVKVSPI